MKSSIHLLYGIIIGILAMFCVGQKQEDKKKFEEVKIVGLPSSFLEINKRLAELKKEGWTIIDWEESVTGGNTDSSNFLVGK
jgi:hypothetical protein